MVFVGPNGDVCCGAGPEWEEEEEEGGTEGDDVVRDGKETLKWKKQAKGYTYACYTQAQAHISPFSKGRPLHVTHQSVPIGYKTTSVCLSPCLSVCVRGEDKSTHSHRP